MAEILELSSGFKIIMINMLRTLIENGQCGRAHG